MDFLIQADHALFILINQTLAHPYLDGFFPFITDMNKAIWFKWIAVPLVLGGFLYKYKKTGLLYFLFCLLSVGFTDWSGTKIFKHNVERPRPFETEGLHAIVRSKAKHTSFISNHASNMFAFATYVSAFFPGARLVVYTAAALIAYSRVYNGVHFPLDVVCGALWGIAISLLFVLTVRFIKKKLVVL